MIDSLTTEPRRFPSVPGLFTLLAPIARGVRVCSQQTSQMLIVAGLVSAGMVMLPFNVSQAAKLAGCGTQETETEVRLAGVDQAGDWETDIDLAIENAKKDGKFLLLDFTGSDWCPPCIRLEQEVLSQDAFLQQAQKNFLLVKLDFPQDQTKVPAKMMEKNQEWMKRLGVEGFPTIVLLDTQGRPFGFLGYMAGGPAAFLAEIEQRLANKTRFDQLMEQAAAKEGPEKAQLLDQALEAIELEIGQTHYTAVVDEILALDPNNELSLREKYRGDLDSEQRKAVLADILLMARLQAPADVLQFMDRVKTEIQMTPQMEATLLQIRVGLEKNSGLVDAALASLDRLSELYGDDDDAWQRTIVRKFYLMLSEQGADAALSMLDTAIESRPRTARLFLAKGDYFEQQGEIEKALLAYDQGSAQAVDSPDLYAELIEAKADTWHGNGKVEDAITALEQYAANDKFPADLRAKALIHKAVFLREQNKLRAALLSENKALGLIDSPKQRAELERMIEQVRAAFADSSER